MYYHTGGCRCYDRFCLDFLRRESKAYIYPFPSKTMEADIYVEWGRLQDLFITREDLVHSYFADPILSDEMLQEMIRKFMNDEREDKRSARKKQLAKWRVNPLVNGDVWEWLAQMISSMEKPIFKETITGQHLRDFLEGTINKPLKAASNCRLSFFVGWLAKENLIVKKWLSKIGKESKAISAESDKPISYGSYKTLWNEYKEYEYDEFGIILKYVKFVSRSIEASSFLKNN